VPQRSCSGRSQAMSHVRIAVYSLVNGAAKEVGDRAQEGMLGIFRGQAGFKATGWPRRKRARSSP